MSDLYSDPHYCAWDSGEDRVEWTVHVMGPDDILPAASSDDAVKQANEINTSLPPRTEYSPYMFAVPCRKGTYAYPNDGNRVLS